MNFQRKRSKRVQLQDISMTPLIDTALTLLIIFMITTPIIQDSIRLNLPETKNQHSSSKLSDEPTVVSITKEGVFLNERKLNIHRLKEEIKRKISVSKDKNVVVRGDKDVIFDKVIKVVDDISAVEGVTGVNLATKHINQA